MINPVGLAGFCLLGAVSADNDAPSRASRPFDATRNGFVLGEGAGFVVLESWERAVARGARRRWAAAARRRSLASEVLGFLGTSVDAMRSSHGGAGGNRTPVRKPSPDSSTCVVL